MQTVQQTSTSTFDIKDIFDELRQAGFKVKLWTGNRTVRIYVNGQDYIEFYFNKPCYMEKNSFGRYLRNDSKNPEIMTFINNLLFTEKPENDRVKKIMEKIKCAQDMAKYTGKYHIATEAKVKVEAGKLDSAEKFLRSYGF